MGRLAVKVLLFVLPIIALWAWLERGLRTIETSSRVKRAGLEAKASEIEVLVGGASSADNGVNPASFLVPAYNIAGPSQSLHYDLAIVSKYLEQLPKLRLVVVVQPYWYVSFEMRNYSESWRQHFYAVFWDVPLEAPTSNFVTIQQHSFVALYTPPVAAEYAARGFKVPLAEAVSPDGWAPIRVPSLDEAKFVVDSEFARVRASGHSAAIRPESEAKNIAELTVLGARLKRRGIKLVMVWVPVAEAYRTAFGPETIAKQRAVYEELKQKGHIEFFDYSADPRFTTEDFFNADHLHRQGAEKFSGILAAEVVAPLLANAISQHAH